MIPAHAEAARNINIAMAETNNLSDQPGRQIPGFFSAIGACISDEPGIYNAG